MHDLKAGSHRVLIFTQMTKVLDILESFLSFHGHTYMRLDGSTKVEQRQMLMERYFFSLLNLFFKIIKKKHYFFPGLMPTASILCSFCQQGPAVSE